MTFFYFLKNIYVIVHIIDKGYLFAENKIKNSMRILYKNGDISNFSFLLYDNTLLYLNF